MTRTHPQRPNVCLIVQNKSDLIFLGRRAQTKGTVWQLPQGGVDAGETVEAAALREVSEELGIQNDKLEVERVLKVKHSYTFDSPRKYGGTIFSGQEQHFVVIRFIGEESDISLDIRELDAYTWCTAEEVLSRAEAQRLPGYKKAFAELQNQDDRSEM